MVRETRVQSHSEQAQSGKGRNFPMRPLDLVRQFRYLSLMVRFVLLFLLLASCSAQARIGETLAQCENRYGPAIERRKATQKESDPDSQVFSKSGITIVAEFHKGVVWKIIYSKVGMEPSELETLLAANANESPWTPPLKITGQEVRATANRERIAVYVIGGRLDTMYTLTITSAEYAKANRSEYLGKLAEVPGLLKQRLEGNKLKDF